MMSPEEAKAFLAGIVGEEAVNKLEEDAEAAKQQQIADAKVFYDVFGAGRGPELLELLRLKFLNASNMENPIEAPGIPLNPGEFMAMREGQNAIVRWLDRMVKLAQEEV